MVGIYKYIAMLCAIIMSASIVHAVSIDLSSASFAYDEPIISGCIESSIGCSRIVSDPIHREVEVSTSPLNETHDTWTATVTVSTSFDGAYRNVPLTIEVPKTAQLNAGGNTPYTIHTRDDRRFIALSIPELEDERTVRVSVLLEKKPSIWERITRLVPSL